jgi:hypothetical protein
LDRRWLIAFSLVGALYAFPIHYWSTFHAANESIRLYFVQSLVDYRSASIDPVLERYAISNPDRVEHEGRAYLDKAPGLPLAVVPVYALLVAVGLSTEFVDLPYVYYVLQLFGVGIPALLGVWWVRALVWAWTDDERAATTAALITGLATPYTLYATMFFGHTTAAALAIGSLLQLERNRPIAAGGLAGAMVLVDTPTAVLAAMLGVCTGVRRRSLVRVVRFALAGLPFVALQLAYNTWLFGHPLTFAYSLKATAALAAIHDQGLYGFTLPRPQALWGLTFGAKRGLFYHAPILLLAPLGIHALVRSARNRANAGVLSALALGYFLWISCFVDWTAGESFGPRHLVPIVPFLGIAVGASLADPAIAARARMASAVLVLASAVMIWAPLITFPYARLAFEAPVAQLALPLLKELHLGPTLATAAGFGVGASLLVLVTLAIALLATVRPDWRLLAVAPAGLILVAVLAAAAPGPTRDGRFGRMLAECRLGYPDSARALCWEEDGTWIRPQCLCVRPHPPAQSPARSAR